MRVLCLIRQVLDAEESVKIREGFINLAGSKLVVDTMDEYGVEEALRLREANAGTEVVVAAIGGRPLRRGSAQCARHGRRPRDPGRSQEPLDVIATSSVVAQIAKTEAVDLIFCGGQQADWDSHGLGPATAERLGWPQATWTNALTLEGAQLAGKHDIDAGSETFTITLPAVVTTQQGLNEPRYPTLPNIMKAKRKEMRRDSLATYNVQPKLKYLKSEVQVQQRRRTILDGKDSTAAAQQLVGLLRNEARVIG